MSIKNRKIYYKRHPINPRRPFMLGGESFCLKCSGTVNMCIHKLALGKTLTKDILIAGWV